MSQLIDKLLNAERTCQGPVSGGSWMNLFVMHTSKQPQDILARIYRPYMDEAKRCRASWLETGAPVCFPCVTRKPEGAKWFRCACGEVWWSRVGKDKWFDGPFIGNKGYKSFPCADVVVAPWVSETKPYVSFFLGLDSDGEV